MSTRSHFAPNAVTAIKASLFAMLALGTLALGACSHSGPRQNNPNAFEWSGALAGPATVQIRNTMGSITVEPSPDNTLRVVGATSWTRGDPKRDVQFRVATANNIVTVCALWGDGKCSATNYSTRAKRNGFNFSIGGRSDAKVAFTVQVPAGIRIDSWTMDGDISVRAAAPVRAHTVNGSVKVGTAVGPVDAETVNGNVDIRMTTMGIDSGAVRAVTKNGTAVAYVPQITDGRIETSTINGSIGTDFGDATGLNEGRSRTFKSTFGAGAREYVVETLNGSAFLRLINADGTVGQKGATAAPRAVSAVAKTVPAKKRNQ